LEIPTRLAGFDLEQAELEQGGFRTKRNVLAKLSYIEADQAEVIKLHEVIEDNADVVVVRLYNPFEQPLKPEARARYDGAALGPLARSVPIAVALEPGGQLDVTLDKRIDHLVRGQYGDRTIRVLLASIELSLFSPDMRMEASLPLDIR